jgi:D-alanyl-D-alanine carboxypeptidase
MKTVTGSAAFHYLGTDYQYKTLLQYSGTINGSGILDGYIYIMGKL